MSASEAIENTDKHVQPKTSNWPAAFAGMAILMLCAVVVFMNPRFLKAVSFQSYDVLTQHAAVPPQSDRVVIVDIDRRSMAEVGQWAWPRYLVARMLDNLWSAGAKVVAFDVVFPEADRTSPNEILNTLRGAYGTNVVIEGLPEAYGDFDWVFAEALSRGRAVLGCYMFLNEDRGLSVEDFEEADPEYKGQFLVKGTADMQYLPAAKNLDISLPELLRVSDTGFFNTVKDQDDIVRRTPLVVAAGPYRMYASLALQAVRLYLDQPRFTVVFDDEGVRGMKYIQLKGTKIPTDANGQLVLNFRDGRFPTISAVDVLNNTFDPEWVKDRIVLIGTSAIGLHDMRNTPFHTELPGVEFQATAIDNMLAGDMLREPRWMVFAGLLGLVIGGLLLIAVVIHTRALFSVLVLAFCLVYPLVLSVAVLNFFNLVFVPTPIMMSWLVTYLGVTVAKYWQKEIVEEFNTRLRIVNDNLQREIEIRKKTEADLVVARNQALSAAEAKSQFLANMSHEIRTPMNGVIGMAELALKTKLNPKQLNYVNKITISAKALLRIINDILDFSKIEAGRLDVETTEFLLPDVLEEVADLFADKAADKGVDYVIDCSPDVPAALLGDPLRLRQVMVNLLGNAFKFTDKGQVTLCVHKMEDHHEQSGAHRIKLGFEVRDSGIGIAQENIDKLFSSFTQVDGSTSRKYGGTGLGLSISKQLIELMGGVISLQSELGKGTTFSFILPFECQAEEKEPRNDLPEELQTASVLVCDRNADTCRVLQQLLESWGLHCVADPDPEKLLRQFEPDSGVHRLAILDAALVKSPLVFNAAKTQVEKTIALTPSVADQTHLEEWGVDRSTTKPIKPRELFDTILDAFGFGTAKRRTTQRADTDFAPERFHGIRVVLAEDNPINQEVALENLHSVGICADVANNGIEVLELLDRQPYDLVLMDVQMPEMDGFAASHHIRQRNDKLNEIPIVAMTAHAMMGDMERCLNAGMSDYLTKPIDPDKLFETIARWVPQKEHVPADWMEQFAEDDNEEEVAAAVLPDVAPVHEDQEPSGKAKSEPALLNYADGLRRVRGKTKLYNDLLSGFVESYSGVDKLIDDAVAVGDCPAAARLAHTLHGTAGNLSLPALQKTAGLLEQHLKEQPQVDATSLIDKLEEVLEKTLDAIRAVIRPGDAGPSASPQKKETDLNPEVLQTKLMELDRLLQSGSSQSMDAVDEVSAMIKDWVGAKTAERLHRQVMDFEFNEARNSVQELLQALQDKSSVE